MSRVLERPGPDHYHWAWGSLSSDIHLSEGSAAPWQQKASLLSHFTAEKLDGT